MQHKFLSAAEFFKKAAHRVSLYKNIWMENTTLLFHGKREYDKTAQAFKIATDLASRGREVLYVNTDRRLDCQIATQIDFPEKLSIFIPSYDSPDDIRDYADIVISSIEEAVAATSIRTFIIDSVTRIAALSFGKNASVAYVMKRLVALQVRHKLSLLIISHDSTKAIDRALLNLSDSEIAVEPSDSTTDSTVSSSPNPKKTVHSDHRLLQPTIMGIKQEQRSPDCRSH